MEKAKRYSSIKYRLAIIDIIYLVVLLFLFLALGLSRNLASHISKLVINRYFVLPAFLFVTSLIYYILDFPLNFYRTFILEHKFSLSNQNIRGWLFDQIKAALLSYVISLILLAAFYVILQYAPHIWWLIVSLFWIFFNFILAKVVPIVIIPLFFKYQKILDQILKDRIINLADKMRVKILNVFEIDFSKKTLKANAAFVGVGNTRRIVLADTLKDKYTYDEIEVILAHEFAHYRLKHLLKLILLNSFAIILSFYLIFKTSHNFLGIFGLFSLQDIAALPVILIYLVILGLVTQPFQNYISRRLEKNADILALKVTGLKGAFISMMDKLASQNLADRSPSKIIKIFFFDHPPVDERIALARSLNLNN